MNYSLTNARIGICTGCLRLETCPVAKVAAKEESVCPLDKWKDIRVVKSALPIGSVVKIVARPFAAMSDKIFGTGFQGCGGCGQREENWNEAGQKLAEGLGLAKPPEDK